MGQETGLPWAIPPAFRRLPAGAVQPRGRMRAQMADDLARGFAGSLDLLTTGVSTDLVLHRIDAAPGAERQWWPAECRGNWLLGYQAMAHFTSNARAVERMDGYARALRGSQDDDGYLGIYTPSAREAITGENGELWSMSRVLHFLLDAFELRGDDACRVAAASCADWLVARRSPGRDPFFRDITTTGVSHGLMIVDALERLWVISGADRYRDCALGLYEEFSGAKARWGLAPAGQRGAWTEDVIVDNLLDAGRVFTGHGVQTLEKLRVPLFAAYAAGGERYRRAAAAGYEKARQVALPSGAVVSDEFILGRVRPAPTQYYEFCALTEHMASLLACGEKTGAAACADEAESILFNAAQGARTPDGTALTYFSRDEKPDTVGTGAATGRKFSPTHEDAAPCCNPNATRILPEFVKAMWMLLHDPSRGEGIVAFGHGPSQVTARLGTADVRITQESPYPFAEELDFALWLSEPRAFAFAVRVPGWARGCTVAAPGATVEQQPGFVVLRRRWESGDHVRVSFGAAVEAVDAHDGTLAVRRGPLLYAMPIPSRRVVTKHYAVPGFEDYDLLPTRAAGEVALRTGSPDLGLSLERDPDGDPDHPWARPPRRLTDGHARLLPMGCTLLRTVSWPGGA